MIVIKELYKSFHSNSDESFHALKDINLTIADTEVVVLKGISGSGKSTLLSIIAGIMKPSSGAVEVNGENIVSLSDYHASTYRNTKVGFVTQSFHLFDELNARENIIIPLVVTTLSDKEVDKQVEEAMNIANISHKAQQKANTLSGGEKQRCIIARALVNNPDIILCDEPTANLDYENSLKFLEIITKLKKMGKTIIIATHDPIFNSLSSVDRILHIKDGSLE
jgi:putative ABC transport system ATP-binding protein